MWVILHLLPPSCPIYTPKALAPLGLLLFCMGQCALPRGSNIRPGRDIFFFAKRSYNGPEAPSGFAAAVEKKRITGLFYIIVDQCVMLTKYNQQPGAPALTHRSFYTQTVLDTHPFTPQTFLHPDVAIHINAFTHERLYTNTFLHTDAFGQINAYTQRNIFYTLTIRQKLWNTEDFCRLTAFIYRDGYTQTLSHTEAVALRHKHLFLTHRQFSLDTKAFKKTCLCNYIL